MVELLDKFEREQSDVILENLQRSIQFVRFVADVTYLFFPAMLDTAVGASDSFSERVGETQASEPKQPTRSQDPTPPSGPDSPDRGDLSRPPGADGPDPV
jgi:hypothetical protein